MVEQASTSGDKASRPSFSALTVVFTTLFAVLILAATACGDGGEFEYFSDDSVVSGVVSTVVVEKEVVVERELEVDFFSQEESLEVEEATSSKAVAASEDSAENVDISFQPQSRIIVRNADMVVQSEDPVATVDSIGALATSIGGWVVNSNANDLGFYSITVRVPAESLDDVIDQISRAVSEVDSVTSDSTDFTEEYIDLGARRTTIQETIDALTVLLRSENYDSVEELLEVQREITQWQSELEIIDGRLSFISESAAFSRLSVQVNQSPIPMLVDVGEDVNVGIGVGHKYTARFYPPDGYDRFEIVWDFGDGSRTQKAVSALRTQGEDGYLSVPVRHSYGTDEFSPHVVTAKVRAYADRGVAEGEDQLWVNVSELPQIDPFIFASDESVEQGQDVVFTASFNHPDGLRNVSYTWDFRDGTQIQSGTVEPGVSGVEVKHAFERHRPEAYRVVFEISGDSDAGKVSETRETYVYIYPSPSVEGADFDAGGTATDALNTLIAVASLAGTAAIWLAITSPVWLILGAILFFVVRFARSRQRNVQRVVFVPNAQTQPPTSSEENERQS